MIAKIDMLLQRAAALVEQGWTQGNSAIDVAGVKRRFDDKLAAAFDLEAAIARACFDQHGPGWVDPFSEASALARAELRRRDPSAKSLRAWNDDPARTRAEVASLLSAAGIVVEP